MSAGWSGPDMERLDKLEAVAAPIAIANCDTDQIIPGEFLQKPRSMLTDDWK